ncbi:PKD domain-containing protein [Desulfobacterales bacterium HSG2]|nr:PKD domain-containing protein [Desulfobacterales bacterium HSG2]
MRKFQYVVFSFQWDLEDGVVENPKSEIRIRHRFERPGEYRVRLTVTDDSETACNTAEDVVNIRVNSPPVADAGGDREAYVGGAHDALLFDASGSSDADGDPLTFYWDFGDGTAAQGQKVFHYFEKPGTYSVKLRVEDGTGLKSGVIRDEITVRARLRK